MDNNIQNYNVNRTFGAKKMEEKQPKNFQEQVDMTVAKLAERSEREVPEYGDFAPVIEFFDNLDEASKNTVGKYGIMVLKLPKNVRPDPKQRYIEASAYEPTGNYKSKMYVGSGYKEDIHHDLYKFTDKLADVYAKLADSLND